MKETLIFLHIPKAGGNTLNEFLLGNFPEEARFDVNAGLKYRRRLTELAKLPTEKKNRLELVYGHLPFGVHEHLPLRCRYITVLRDPVDRIASHYFFVREQRNHPLHQAIVSQNLSLAEYAVSGLSGELNNGMTRLISGRPASDSIRGHGECNRGDLSRAIENLEMHFDVVGLLESVDSTLDLLSAVYRWPRVATPVRNPTKSRRPVDSLSEMERNAILSVNQLDVELYDWGKRNFAERCERAGVEIRLNRDRKATTFWRRFVSGFTSSLL